MGVEETGYPALRGSATTPPIFPAYYFSQIPNLANAMRAGGRHHHDEFKCRKPGWQAVRSVPPPLVTKQRNSTTRLQDGFKPCHGDVLCRDDICQVALAKNDLLNQVLPFIMPGVQTSNRARQTYAQTHLRTCRQTIVRRTTLHSFLPQLEGPIAQKLSNKDCL